MGTWAVGLDRLVDVEKNKLFLYRLQFIRPSENLAGWIEI